MFAKVLTFAGVAGCSFAIGTAPNHLVFFPAWVSLALGLVLWWWQDLDQVQN